MEQGNITPEIRKKAAEFREALRDGRVSYHLSPESTLSASDVYKFFDANAERIVDPRPEDRITMKDIWGNPSPRKIVSHKAKNTQNRRRQNQKG